MTNQITITNDQIKKKFDLEERTTRFGEEIIKFAKNIPESSVTKPLIIQLVKSGTSIGANYCEADDAESKKDFNHKIGICKKEARETKYWLRMIMTTIPELQKEAEILFQEAKELNLIFNAIIRTSRKNDKVKSI